MAKLERVQQAQVDFLFFIFIKFSSTRHFVRFHYLTGHTLRASVTKISTSMLACDHLFVAIVSPIFLTGAGMLVPE